ncbi:YbhB/YbcL family Raf kinase inhibitor-like protein [Pseudomonas sp. G11-1]|uniref:Phospholipid-binding protein, PBP family n=1 Tax=Halopseudomonas bauzanensis TaxID=653930 RepID=A0A031MES9_9GAMM|nr:MULTISPECIES: YbhB/YbcL family Raf kinase inhibitor-like protein [Halopseudomonas]MCO5785932.1 YbhB/YbcL family Raf kinase inhibitor-like protein [Pseudomonas sp. G11-1]MCO5787964.1 YbhB/YbcL family Raf kinase inhibitor-like protein [Pseudomonas sp. G11-2]EZQ18294.1 phospholipid-binding protein [Halopseudomonas bauzanensis]WGK61521.1 YbhB/YbcL family Raf kinase inhibitor-like protein [Halopseudomonas sp. SMJS2]SES37578.1 phospholipid-binding protein, PBP family [Halopseudomonas bauzanensis]
MGFALNLDLQLTSSAFTADGAIPTRHTGEGEDISPALSWSNAPAGTKSFAVICHDPDAPLVSANGTYGFVHWVLYNIPGEVTSLAEGCGDYTQGQNNFGKTGYGGPMPPEGHGQHKYYFWVLALDAEPDLSAGLDLWQLLAKVEPHTLAMNRLVGTYQRG